MPIIKFLNRKEQSRELVPIDDLVAALPFICRRDGRIVAAFARLKAAQDWASDKSYSDESLFVIHTAAEVLAEYRAGDQVEA
jgi:hypothetical protein